MAMRPRASSRNFSDVTVYSSAKPVGPASWWAHRVEQQPESGRLINEGNAGPGPRGSPAISRSDGEFHTAPLSNRRPYRVSLPSLRKLMKPEARTGALGRPGDVFHVRGWLRADLFKSSERSHCSYIILQDDAPAPTWAGSGESRRASSGGAKMVILPFWIREEARELDERSCPSRADQGYG